MVAHDDARTACPSAVSILPISVSSLAMARCRNHSVTSLSVSVTFDWTVHTVNGFGPLRTAMTSWWLDGSLTPSSLRLHHLQ